MSTLRIVSTHIAKVDGVRLSCSVNLSLIPVMRVNYNINRTVRETGVLLYFNASAHIWGENKLLDRWNCNLHYDF